MASPDEGDMATIKPMLFFNVQDGFPEGLVRGYRYGFLKDVDYHHLCQCETLEDLKLNLAETDFGNFLEDHPSDIPLAPSIFRWKAIERLESEFNYLKGQCVGDLRKFMDFITYEYMINNVMLLLKGTLTNPDVSPNELLEQCHPLGMFDDSAMRSICTFENTPKGYAELYSTVLIDTPVGPYFEAFLQQQQEKGIVEGASEVRDILNEVPIPILENSIMKLYLEEFYAFCLKVGGDTATKMGDLLKARADKMTINITLNSFGTPLNEPSMRTSDRKLLYPSFGYLYPDGVTAMSSKGGIEDEDGLGRLLQPYAQYKQIWDTCIEREEKSIDDAFYERDVRLMEDAFQGQCHYGMFYAFTKLKEQEIRNLVWISECIVQNQKEHIRKFIPIFSEHAPWR